jgi:RNA methyltransferase, TrmH family
MPTASDRSRSPVIVQSRQNTRVKELRAGFAHPVRTGGDGGDADAISIEGEHLVQEALRSQIRFRAVFVRSGSQRLLDRLSLPEQVPVLELTPDVFASAVETESPQGIAALVEPPHFDLQDALAGTRPLVVVTAALQDPGNLGTLVRSAEAFGATGVIVLPGTVSIWNSKALRASSGSAFRTPVVFAHFGEAGGALRQRGIQVLAAVAAEGTACNEVNLTEPTAILIGNEGSGLPDELLRDADAAVRIPTPGPVESLNAGIAASILLYEAARQRAGKL